LFAGFLKVVARCAACELDLSAADSADGPAVFVMFITGPVAVGLAIWMEIMFQPPMWLQLAILLPTVLVLSLMLLRPLKGLMIGLQYHHRAGEGGKNTFT